MLRRQCTRQYKVVSIHAFRGEGDGVATPSARLTLLFQSTPSGGKATGYDGHSIAHEMFQSTPSGGKATVHAVPVREPEGVSIHAFRGEGDARSRKQNRARGVSIHAFRGEGDLFQQRVDCA